MTGRRVLVCTTFRPFDGGANDRIQRHFLSCLAAQRYRDWHLVATRFREPDPTELLRSYGLPFTVVHKPSGEHRYSLTEVLLSGVDRISGPGRDVLLWCCCDLSFGPDFLGAAVEACPPMGYGACLPQPVADSLDDLLAGRTHPELVPQIDALFFDADVFLRPEAVKDVREYPNIEWGGWETFLIAFAAVYARGRGANLWPRETLVKIENDRSAPHEKAVKAWGPRNEATFERFMRDRGLDPVRFGEALMYERFESGPWYRRWRKWLRFRYREAVTRLRRFRPLYRLRRCIGLERV